MKMPADVVFPDVHSIRRSSFHLVPRNSSGNVNSGIDQGDVRRDVPSGAAAEDLGRNARDVATYARTISSNAFSPRFRAWSTTNCADKLLDGPLAVGTMQ